MRPETAEAWRAALRHTSGPVALALTRQKLPVIDRSKYASAEGLHRGAYVLAETKSGKPDVVIIATGSEVTVALSARDVLEAKTIQTRVVSMPCWEFFSEQEPAYRESVIPRSARLRVALEAATPFGWERWVGEDGLIIGIDHYGASAPYRGLDEKFRLLARECGPENSGTPGLTAGLSVVAVTPRKPKDGKSWLMSPTRYVTVGE